MQRGIEVEPPGGTSAHTVDVEDRVLTATAAVLGPVHCDVGVVQQVVAGLAVLAERTRCSSLAHAQLLAAR